MILAGGVWCVECGVWCVVCGGLAAGWHQDTAAAGQVRNVSPATTRQSHAARQPGHIAHTHTHISTQLAVQCLSC